MPQLQPKSLNMEMGLLDLLLLQALGLEDTDVPTFWLLLYLRKHSSHKPLLQRDFPDGC